PPPVPCGFFLPSASLSPSPFFKYAPLVSGSQVRRFKGGCLCRRWCCCPCRECLRSRKFYVLFMNSSLTPEGGRVSCT
ncbi:MAG: hypothetical protein ACI4RG_10160, partial [Huintestinicola sp.]